MLPAVFTIVALALGGASGPGAVPDDTIDVLFVGNSYTYYNNLPGMLEALSAGDPGAPAIQAEMTVTGGATLGDHLHGGDATRAIRGGGWDYVVLQGQSTFGTVYLVNGSPRVADPSRFARAAVALDSVVRGTGARTVFFQHWPRRGAPTADGQRIARAYMTVAERVGAGVAPVGLAWQEALAAGVDERSLYADDGSHPAPAGSYLAAAVLYETLTGRDAMRLPATAHGSPVHPRTGVVASDSTTLLVELRAERATRLKGAAHAAVGRLRAAGGYLAVEDPGPLTVPELPAGQASSPPSLRGQWRGPLNVYPYPATLVLGLTRRADEWALTARVEFDGGPDDIEIDVTDLSVGPEGLRFVDPAGPNGGEVRYRGVWTEEGLDGLAEIVVPSAPIHGVGTWSGRRQDPAPAWRGAFGYGPDALQGIEVGAFGFPYLPVVVAGDTVELPFDTGNMVGITLASDLFHGRGLPCLERHRRYDSGGKLIGSPCVAKGVSVSAFGAGQDSATVYEFSHRSLPGLVGPGALPGTRFTLDYHHGLMAVDSGFTPDTVPGYASMPLVRSPRHPRLILVRGRVGDREVIVEIDTGKSRTTIDRALVRALGLETSPAGAEVGAVRLGPWSFTVESARVVDTSGISGGLPAPISLGIGSDILSRFVFTVDYRAGRMWLEAPGR